MNLFKAKTKAIELFENGWDIENVADQLEIDQEKVESWYEDYELEQSLEGLSEDQDKMEELSVALRERNSIRKEELELYKSEREQEEVKSKRSKVILFKKLFTFIKNHCESFKWDHSEVILFIKKLKTLKCQIEEVAAHDEDVFQKLFIWNRTGELIEHLESLVQDYEEGDSIKFDFGENDVLFLEESLDITDFDDEIEEVTEEEQTLAGLLEDEFSPKKY